MAEVVYTVERWAETTLKVTWPATAALYYVWIDGWLEAVISQTEWQFDLAPDEPVVAQIFDDAADVPDPAYPARAWLHWNGGDSDVQYWRVDQDNDGTWETQAQIPNNGGSYFGWRSSVLADGETYTWQVVPVGANGEDGLALEIELEMVRHPDPPEPSYELDEETGVVTVS